MHNSFKIPILRYYPSMVIVYDQRYDFPERSEKQIENEKNLSRGVYNGYMSPKTKSKVRKYLTTWIASINEIRKLKNVSNLKKIPYLTFITLTLPSQQVHEDNEIKRKCLIPFIQTLQRKFNVWNYFWRAEAQANGNIHFHLIIDSYINHVVLRNEWNACVNKLDYVYEFYLKHGHNNPNSTDIHSLKDVTKTGEYLLKYVSKSEGYREIDGRIHGCSDRVRCLNPYECEIDSVASETITELKRNPANKIITDDTYTIILLSNSNHSTEATKKIKERANAHYRTIGRDLYTNREASEIEMQQAQALAYYEENQDSYQQLSLGFEDQIISMYNWDKV